MWKTPIRLCETDQRLRSIKHNHSPGVEVVGCVVKFTDALKLLGVPTLDSSLSFDRHISPKFVAAVIFIFGH